MFEGKTIREATEIWTREMNAIQQDMIGKLMAAYPDEWTEVTTPAYGDRVYFFADTKGDGGGKITEVKTDEDDTVYTIELDNGDTVKAHDGEFEVERDGVLPMWGTMWSMGDSADDYWLEELDGIKLMSECGFRVYEHDEFGYFFGIDGCGYDFYESHWCPLYRARGLRWHDNAAEAVEFMIEKGTEETEDGEFSFDYDFIGKKYEETVDEEFLKRAETYANEKFGYKIESASFDSCFKFKFHKCYCRKVAE